MLHIRLKPDTTSAPPAEAGHYVCYYSTSPAGGRPSIGSSVSNAY